MTAEVRTGADGGVAWIEMARPDKRNALTLAMYDAMAGALERADRDPAVRVTLLHGQPGCFTAGNDLSDFVAGGGAVSGPATRFLRAISTARKPVVAAVGGVAVGIGTTLLLHCDLVFAAPGARLQLPFVPMGLAPEGGASLLLPMIAGHARAMELLLLGRPFGAEEARSFGLVNEVVPEERLLERAREAARAVAALPEASVLLTKEMLKRPHAALLQERMAEELRVFGERLASPEARRALQAFFERKRPGAAREGGPA